MGGNIEGISGDISKWIHGGIVVVRLKWFGLKIFYISVKIKQLLWYNNYLSVLMKYLKKAMASWANCMTVTTWKQQ